jgi:hypothetical protein
MPGTVRPDPSTLGAVGERGSHHEDCSQSVPGAEVLEKTAVAANQAIGQLDHDGRPDSLPEDLRLYDLRHTAASLMIRQGASVKAVQRQLGHATASITLDTYGHLFPDELDALADRLEDARAEALATLARTERTSGRAAAGRCWSASRSRGAGGGARTLMPLRAQRF